MEIQKYCHFERSEKSAFARCTRSRFLAEFIPSEVEGLGMTILEFSEIA